MFLHRSLLLGVSTFAVVPLLVLAASPPWEIRRRHTELFVAGSADDASLRRRIAALSPTVSPDEARRVAYAAYMTGLELRREWRVVWLPGVQNLLVNMGARKGGLCFQWATELLVRLDALKLQTLELHWAESFAKTSGEHNVIVVTAREQACSFKASTIYDEIELNCFPFRPISISSVGRNDLKIFMRFVWINLGLA